ncbi:hypothetical protein NEUTE1DRAFT_120518 [Neurospora tetrasperma FGSC 2508]|uniref:Methyltransferase n=1 Tax=Neurospora tetrasperma (strain FGSC 2508 / ATCC MYA-4615 / P0657) TaxID=510951 RepID=F8MED2_NEUT8|nr:uncharacterized protein NEUTE1DRAFT_120518 [Neurospora tetrasperma FGSC 2508]EGO61614.1 hypothetical protein NEUTE1DRAFT_120518 [Neurospora tetrasperma FGSC 2508]
MDRNGQDTPRPRDATPDRADQKARLNYIQWEAKFLTEKPYEFISQAPEGCPRKNFTLATSPEQTIHDIRGSEELFNLDDHAFQVVRQEIGAIPTDQKGIECDYLPKIVELLQSIDPGAEVVVFDWRLRTSDYTRTTAKAGSVIDLDDPMLILKPVHAVHIDQSPLAATKRVNHHMGARAQELLQRRFRIINTLQPHNLIAVDHVRKNYQGEGLYPLYDEAMKWYYLHRQTKDEVLLFKTFDSADEVVVKARSQPSSGELEVGSCSKPPTPRESIEVRAMVFSKDGG